MVKIWEGGQALKFCPRKMFSFFCHSEQTSEGLTRPWAIPQSKRGALVFGLQAWANTDSEVEVLASVQSFNHKHLLGAFSAHTREEKLR